MTETKISGWIKHLKHPMVLIGFVFMLFAGIIEAMLKKDILTALGEDAAPIITNAIYLIFLLGALIIISAFFVQKRKISTDTTTDTDKITQKTSGDQSPAVVSKGDKSSVNINYGSSDKPSEHKD